MSAKALALVLAATLLGAGAPCACLDVRPAAASEQTCGHCPDEGSTPPAKPADEFACCCVDGSLDRSVEAAYSVATPVLDLDLSVDAAAPAAASFGTGNLAEAPDALPPRGSPPLYLLHRHLAI